MRHRRPMIDLGTLAGLLEHRHVFAAYCPRCDRWAVIDLAATVDTGLGDRRLPTATFWDTERQAPRHGAGVSAEPPTWLIRYRPISRSNHGENQ